MIRNVPIKYNVKLCLKYEILCVLKNVVLLNYSFKSMINERSTFSFPVLFIIQHGEPIMSSSLLNPTQLFLPDSHIH